MCAQVTGYQFCETTSVTLEAEVLLNLVFCMHTDDPLWDGQGCGRTSTCCEFNNPPWFCKQLPQSTTNDIELRICGDEVASNLIEHVEIYIR